jgi:deoxyadenosine/deoxycytidine kinase
MLSRAWDAISIFEQFTDNPFLPLFYKNPERYGFQVELFFMTERHKQLEEIQPKHDLFQNTYIADYFFKKTLLFAGNNLVSEEFKLFKRFYDILERTAPVPDLLVYLHREVPQLSRQIRGRNRSIEQDIDEKYLEGIQNAYFDYFRQVTHFPILILEMSGMDFENDKRDFKFIKDIIDQSYLPGVHRLSISK